MTINSIGSYSPYTSYGYLNVSNNNNQNQEGKIKPPNGGPQGGGRPPGGDRPPKGPNLDTDEDGSWNISELEEYAAYSSDELGISIDAEDLMSTYDQDGDGMIGSEERNVLAQNNGLQLQRSPSKPPMSSGGMPPLGNVIQGPNLDSDDDDSWSMEELENYAAYIENLGISLDISEIMDSYDQDENGAIDSEERELLAEEDGLQLSDVQSYTISQGIDAYLSNMQYYSA